MDEAATGLPIRTNRLVVRPFRATDWHDLHAYLSLPEVYAYEPGSPIDEATAKRLAAERSASLEFLALELAASGRVIGHCSLVATGAPEDAARSLGFIVHPHDQGQGFAAEGGRAVVDWAFMALGLHRVVAECDPRNVASWRTLERIGLLREGHLRSNVFFRRDADGRPMWQDTYIYAIVDPL